MQEIWQSLVVSSTWITRTRVVCSRQTVLGASESLTFFRIGCEEGLVVQVSWLQTSGLTTCWRSSALAHGQWFWEWLLVRASWIWLQYTLFNLAEQEKEDFTVISQYWWMLLCDDLNGHCLQSVLVRGCWHIVTWIDTVISQYWWEIAGMWWLEWTLSSVSTGERLLVCGDLNGHYHQSVLVRDCWYVVTWIDTVISQYGWEIAVLVCGDLIGHCHQAVLVRDCWYVVTWMDTVFSQYWWEIAGMWWLELTLSSVSTGERLLCWYVVTWIDTVISQHGWEIAGMWWLDLSFYVSCNKFLNFVAATSVLSPIGDLWHPVL